MINEELPLSELKHYGILDKENKISPKLSERDFEKFLSGYIIVVDNEKDRITFQLKENNKKLDVNTYQRDIDISEILKNSQSNIQYSKLTNLSDPKTLDYNTKVFIAQKEREGQIVKEYDLQKDIKDLTKIVIEKKEINEVNKYKIELLKLKEFLLDKIDKFPEIAKEITQNMNIVSNEIETVNSVSLELNKNAGKSKIELDVNDPDLYEDANRKRDEKKEIELEVRRGRKI